MVVLVSDYRELCYIDNSGIYSDAEIEFRGIENLISDNLDPAVFNVVIVLEYTNEQALIESWPKISHFHSIRYIILSDHKIDIKSFHSIPADVIYLALPKSISSEVLINSINNCFHQLLLIRKNIALESELVLSYHDVQNLTQVGQALASEHDLDKLIGLILDKARQLVAADASSLYLTERKQQREVPTHIRFKRSALNLNADEFLLPIDKKSIAGYVALTGKELIIDDCYSLSGAEDYHFNTEFDKAHNYHTKSMMVIPMKNHKNEVTGVLQLINRKKSYSKKLTIEELASHEVFAFDQKSYELVSALAGQAAIAIDNNLLLKDINNLFEGFVKASVTAIEQRDPTTSGHSFRVAEFTTGLARSTASLRDGRFRDFKLTTDQMRELRYASLLHDFGKVGVKEEVLVKPKKLYSYDLENIKWRFRYAKKALENKFLRKKLDYLRFNGEDRFHEYEALADEELRNEVVNLDKMLSIILESNEPSVLEDGNFSMLKKIAEKALQIDSGDIIPFLKKDELLSLSVRRGSLNEDERKEIELHVTHTYEFLVQIPWTSDLSNVPEIAYGHHEKLDGSGYPLKKNAETISLRTRMMTIADIFDALTAWDRPYKKAIPAEKAFDILYEEARANHIDIDLLTIFIESEAYKISNLETN